ncbi:MAG: hypothetical protein AAGA96_14575 [Verrucomicrobiota bacterium]
MGLSRNFCVDAKESYEHVIVDLSSKKVIKSCGLNRLNTIDLV